MDKAYAVMALGVAEVWGIFTRGDDLVTFFEKEGEKEQQILLEDFKVYIWKGTDLVEQMSLEKFLKQAKAW